VRIGSEGWGGVSLIKLKWRILAIPLAFTLISSLGLLIYSPTTRHLTGEQIIFYHHVRDAVDFSLNPFLLFAVSYYATKRIELRYDYTVTISLLLGSLIFPAAGSVFGLSLLIVDPLPYSLEINIAYVVRSLLGGFSQGLQTFSVSFAAMIMASISISPHGARF
ncbi:MAG: hypothetical protein OEY31_03025, partial [Candidatus Bathyarchaeota archaeon]|nr:hypothetical protein [Candidatus Bathyarchaeota archaeon]